MLWDYESARCVPKLGFFEYSRIYIYNVDYDMIGVGDESSGIRPADSFRLRCGLGNKVSVVVEPGRLSIHDGETEIFGGKKFLDIIRVSKEGTVELCSFPNEIHGDMGLPRGRCIFRGFPALRADGPRNPQEALRVIAGE